jgi:hypothetical protein
MLSRGLRPPLARELFAARADFGDLLPTFPQIRFLVPRLRRASRDLGISIEEEFEQIVLEAQNRTETAHQVAALKFYLRAAVEKAAWRWGLDEARGVTNYHLLVDAVDKWTRITGEGVIYLTFNYDTLLELAGGDLLDYKFDTMDSYISNPACRIFKLHGSVNWSCLVGGIPPYQPARGGPSPLEWLMKWSHTLSGTPHFVVAEPGGPDREGNWRFPAIAVPTATKTEESFELPIEHINSLRSVIPLVDRMLVIGWRAAEQHFWKFWQDNRPRDKPVSLEVVDANRTEALKIARRVQELTRVSEHHLPEAAGFSEYIADGGRLSETLK